MPVGIKLIRTKGVLKSAVTEVLNFAVSKQELLAIGTLMEQPGEYEIWVDSRESNSVVSMVDTGQVDEMLSVCPPLRESKMSLVSSGKDSSQAGSLDSPAWLVESQAAAATVNIK
jgi:hypothetical protein